MPASSPTIRAALERLRWKIRAYVWFEGLASTIAVAGLVFWIGLLMDWFWEPSQAVRIFGWCVAASFAAWLVYRQIFSRVAATLDDADLALVIERRFTDFDESLLTAVASAAGPDPGLVRAATAGASAAVTRPAATSTGEALLARATEIAETRLKKIRIEEVFDYRPLQKAILLAVTAIGSVCGFAVWQSEAFAVWMRRLALTSDPWPRTVVLRVDGFAADEQGQRLEKIPPDDRFELSVWADLSGDHKPPEMVEIRFRHEDGRRGRDSMSRVGTVTSGAEPSQQYRYSFQDIADDLRFDVVGGDGRIRDLLLKVVPRPRLIDTMLACEYPTYLRRSPEQLEVTGTMLVPIGTRLRLTARSTKPLEWMRVHDRQMKFDDQHLYADGEDRQSIEIDLPQLEQDITLLISLRDTDGITTREPIRLALVATEDPPPQVAVRPAGIGTIVTPSARIPFQGSIADPHYGMARAWFVVKQPDRTDKVLPLDDDLAGRQELRVDHAVDLRDPDPTTGNRRLDLHPNDTITITVYASDDYDLAAEPQIGASQSFLFEIVTPEKLLSVLQRQELSLRQRFESIYLRMSDARNMLSRIQTPSEDERVAASDDAPPVSDRRRLRVAGVRQNVAQAAQETIGVAEGFEGITLEMVNNRVDTPELLKRLNELIAIPLREIAEQDLVLVENQVEALQSSLEDSDEAAARLTETIDQVDSVLVAMQRVLDSMLELESYNEVVQLLQGIIEDQARLQDETKEQQKARLRGLLDD